MDFGSILIGGLGYGFALLLTLGAAMCLRDSQRAKQGVADCGTNAENLRWFVSNIVIAFLVAVVTRLVLGAI